MVAMNSGIREATERSNTQSSGFLMISVVGDALGEELGGVVVSASSECASCSLCDDVMNWSVELVELVL